MTPSFKAANPGTTVQIEVNDNQALSNNSGIFETSVYQQFPLELTWQADVATTDIPHVTTLSLMTIPPLTISPIAVSFDLVGGIGNWPTWATFTKPAVGTGSVSATLSGYETGVDASVQQVYDAVGSTYLRLSVP